MKTKNYLLEKQPIVFQVLKNSFSKDKMSHAYIISGSKGAPVLQTAIFMAQSLVCEHKDEFNMACEECINCKKISNNSYADFKLINGEDLKNDATMAIQEEFNKSSIEKENKKIYIINLIEKAPIASLNKLLKFIEEPQSNIVAIFTSNSTEKILQTIVSRCQVITLREFQNKDLVDYLIKNDIEKEDAYLISKISNNAEKNLEIINNENYLIIKEILKNSLRHLGNKKDFFIIYVQTELVKKVDNNDFVELFLDMLEACLLQAIIKQEDKEYVCPFFDEYITNISKNYNKIDHMINDITQAKIDLLSNANKTLVFDKLLINLLRRCDNE